MIKRVALFAAVLLLAGCAAVPGEQPQASPGQAAPAAQTAEQADSVALYPAAVSLPVGRELKLKAVPSPAQPWFNGHPAMKALPRWTRRGA